MLGRRELLRAGSLWVAGLALLPGWTRAEADIVEIFMRSDPAGGRVGFDPVGLLLRPGQTVRWINAGDNVHTSTAYHPANTGHPLRIPAAATPWDSGYLIHAGESFELTLEVPGTYDYYCTPHEQAGMVGRLVVLDAPRSAGRLAAPYPDLPDGSPWSAQLREALHNLPSAAEILRQRQIPGLSG